MHVVIFDGKLLPPGRIMPLLEKAAEKAGGGNSFEVTIARTETEMLDAMAQIAEEKASSAEEYFPFNAKEGTCLLELSKICYFKSSNHRICAVLCDGTELYSKTVRVSAQNILAHLLEQGRFIQTFKSCFVNISHIRHVSPDGVQLSDGAVLPVSRKYYGELIDSNRKKLSGLKQGNTYCILACGG